MRKFILNGEDIKSLGGYILCDNDFLSLFLTDDFLLEVLELFPSKLALHPFTKLEFLREVWLPEQRSIKERITKTAFIELENHPEFLKRDFDTALDLSRLYGHKTKKGISLVDLLIASRVKNTGAKCYIATGNAKDFPSFIFNTVAVINFEENSGSMRAISILEFDKEKYTTAEKEYIKIIKK